MSLVSLPLASMAVALICGVSLDVKGTGEPALDLTATAQAQPAAPQKWFTSYEQARQLAAKHDLPLLLHFEAKWCGACRRMEGEVLDRADVVSMLGREVVGVRIDADANKNLISEFGITTLPTEVVIYSDGSRGSRYVGATSLTSYKSRLRSVNSSNMSVLARTAKSNVRTASSSKDGESLAATQRRELAQAASHSAAAKVAGKTDKPVRSCLIVRHDGKMVGVGGFSPVALTEGRQWKKGTPLFRVSHEGVCYFLQDKAEQEKFKADPARYIPHLHGCDLVELYNENRATAGAIEYGAFYKGQVYFFASLENRTRFENNPTWYTGVMSDARTANGEMFPFLNPTSINN